MSEPVKVLLYAARQYVSPEMLADQPDQLVAILKADIIAKAEGDGLVVLDGTAEVKFFERNYEWDPSDELPESMQDYLLARSSVRCYRRAAEENGE